jgi:putative transposase
MAHQMIKYKASEAGTRQHWVNTRQIKPSQRCAKCWVAKPKTLAERMHQCPCGHTMPRDQNSALVALIDAHTPGTGVAARQKPLRAINARKPKSKTRETPTAAPPGVQ